MPRYCFSDEDGNTICRSYPMDSIPKKVKLGGKVFLRDIRQEHCSVKNTAGNWPMKSDAAGVASHQSKEAYEHSVRIGIPTEFTSDGRAIFTSRKHRKDYCRAIGLHDRNGGYGDP